MPLAATLRRALGLPVLPPSPRDPLLATTPVAAHPEPKKPATPITRRRRLTPTGWRKVLVDTGVLHWVRWDSRTARYEVLAAAAGLPVVEFVDEVKKRYAAVLKRDEFGRRPMEIDDFAAQLRALATADPDATARLDQVRLQGDEAERRAAVAHRRRKAAEKTATARGLAAVLAAGALVGTAVDAPVDPAPPPAA